MPMIVIQLHVSLRATDTEGVREVSTEVKFSYTLRNKYECLPAREPENHAARPPPSVDAAQWVLALRQSAAWISSSRLGQRLGCRHNLHDHNDSPKCLECAEFHEVLSMKTSVFLENCQTI